MDVQSPPVKDGSSIPSVRQTGRKCCSIVDPIIYEDKLDLGLARRGSHLTAKALLTEFLLIPSKEQTDKVSIISKA